MSREVEGCRVCGDWPSDVGVLHAAYTFDGVVRSSIHRFKYRGEYVRGRFLGTLLADAAGHLAAERSLAWDLVVPVSLHRRRRRERGFDQAEILGRAVAARLGVPLATHLVRTLDTRPQVGLDRGARRQNVLGAFRWDGPDLHGQRALLIDDVLTTGATMIAAATVVLAAGAVRVDGLALARQTS